MWSPVSGKEVPMFGKNVAPLPASTEAKRERVDVFLDWRRKYLFTRLEDVFLQLFLLLHYRTPLCRNTEPEIYPFSDEEDM